MTVTEARERVGYLVSNGWITRDTAAWLHVRIFQISRARSTVGERLRLLLLEWSAIG